MTIPPSSVILMPTSILETRSLFLLSAWDEGLGFYWRPASNGEYNMADGTLTCLIGEKSLCFDTQIQLHHALSCNSYNLSVQLDNTLLHCTQVKHIRFLSDTMT